MGEGTKGCSRKNKRVGRGCHHPTYHRVGMDNMVDAGHLGDAVRYLPKLGTTTDVARGLGRG